MTRRNRIRRKLLAWEKKLPSPLPKAEVIIEMTLEHLSPYYPKTAERLHWDVSNDYGSVTARTIFRVLVKLQAQKKIRLLSYPEIGPSCPNCKMSSALRRVNVVCSKDQSHNREAVSVGYVTTPEGPTYNLLCQGEDIECYLP